MLVSSLLLALITAKNLIILSIRVRASSLSQNAISFVYFILPIIGPLLGIIYLVGRQILGLIRLI